VLPIATEGVGPGLGKRTGIQVHLKIKGSISKEANAGFDVSTYQYVNVFGFIHS
jgi:hypothetical protein